MLRTFIFLQESPFQRSLGALWVDDRDDHKDGGRVHFGDSDHQTKSTRCESIFKIDQNQSNKSGTKTASFSQWVEEPFDEMDSTLAVQQYIQQTIRRWRNSG